MDHYIDNNSCDDNLICPHCGEPIELAVCVCICGLCNCLQSVCQCYNCSLKDDCPTEKCERNIK
jgi:hypothetical protein